MTVLSRGAGKLKHREMRAPRVSDRAGVPQGAPWLATELGCAPQRELPSLQQRRCLARPSLMLLIKVWPIVWTRLSGG